MSKDERWSPLLPAEDPARAPRDYTVRTKVWRYKGTSAWHFASVPVKASGLIRQRFGATARGWGSIRVRIRIGGTEWDTSLFPEKKSRTYLFAIKASVRKAERLGHGTRITAHIRIA
ncbi:MAG TPA: DUF1905 domain-containing protein [Candidatus Binatia bacterium]|nr:DUF1905 domain-containing protein [Candidatus Binatia bacterium]